jgi:glycosyltransferase involved in cell wall biosynthesis
LKNILFISLRGDFGGGTKHLDSIIDNIVGYNLFCASPLEVPYGTKWRNYLGESKYFELKHRKFSFHTFIKLLFFVKKNKINIVHSHGKGAGVYSRLIKLFIYSIKVVHTFHGIHLDRYKSNLVKKLYIYYERVFSLLTDININVSIGEQKLCMEKGIINQNNSVVIYKGIDDHYSEAGLDKKKLRKILSLPPEKFIVVTATRFDYQKNMEASLEIARILKDNKDMVFVWIGDGDERNEIEKKSKDLKLANVLFLGYKNKVLELLEASNVYLSTARWEGLPYSLIEASKVGLPIIASNVIGNNEVVLHGENGLLFDLGNLDLASEYIMNLYENEILREDLGAKSREIFDEKFKLNSMIKKLNDIYEEINP